MNKLFALGAAMSLFAIVAVGCQNTAEGVQQDAAKNTEAVKEAGDKAAVATEKAAKDTAAATEQAAKNTADATKAVADRAASATEKATDHAVAATEKATKNTSDALTLTPKVKLAIVNDTELNNTANLVNVESGGGKVELTGHVLTKEMKARAEKLAKQAVEAAGSPDKVVNSLKVEGGK